MLIGHVPCSFAMSDLQLNCWVFGDETQNVFPVKVPKTETVGHLKKAIKEENPDFGEIAARSLVLWKVSILANRSLKEEVTKLDLDNTEPLAPLNGLLEVFSIHELNRKRVHVVVRSPPARACQFL
jgi:Crinkler effector protein N-terminal domain